MTRRLIPAVFPLLFLLACHGTPAPLSSSPVARPFRGTALESLQQRITALVDSPAVAAGTWGVEIRSLATGQSLFEFNSHRLLTPASSMKTITLAVAADQLGWNFTYETRLVARGTIASGALNGDLVVVGSGDPSLDDWDGAASGVFATWASRLRELGVTTVRGHVIADDRAFSGPALGSGWAWDDLALSYSAAASGLQFNEGTAQIVVTPGATGGPATVTVVPPFAPLVIRGSVTTTGSVVASDAPSRAVTARQTFSRTLDAITISGSIPAGSTRIVQNVAVPRPAKYFAEAVRAALRANGVSVSGGALEIAQIDPPPTPAAETFVAAHRSPALSSLADTMMKLSQNLFAESLLRTLGREHGGAGTIEAGSAVEREVLQSWGIPLSDVLVADGSGLSRYNLLTADALVSVLVHVYGDERLRGLYLASLPVAGRSGTLAARMKNTQAEGVVQAKTGSFINARSVAGFVRPADGEPLAFAIIANNYGAGAAEVDRVTDAILVALAEFRR